MTDERDRARPRAGQSPVERALSDPEQAPLSRWLGDGFQEELVPALWRRIGQAPVRRRAGAGALAVVLAAALVLTCGAWLLLRRPSPGPLAQTDGRSPRVLDAGERALATGFDDGSRVELSPFARLEVLRNDERSFVVALRRGDGVFEVKPGGPRRWVIEAGLASVEVVGTHFEVDRSPERVRVRVERGVVIVRGESVPHGMVELVAGGSIELYAEPRAELRDEASPTPSASATVAELPAALPVAAGASIASGRNADAPASAAPGSGDAIDALFASADAARRRGDDAAASAALEAVLRQAPERDARRSLAALSLARLAARADPARAANALDEPAMQAMPQGLAEDALARRVEAEGQAGHRARAAALAAEYEQRFPAGRHLEDVRRWLAP